MSTEQDTPTQVINVAATEPVLAFPPAQLHDDQERRALALERAAGALYNMPADQVVAAADYVISGRNPFDPASPPAG